jgi:hypothetical protein
MIPPARRRGERGPGGRDHSDVLVAHCIVL